MPSVDDLRAAFEDLAANAPTPEAHAQDAPFATTAPLDLVHPHHSAHRRRATMVSALAIAAAAAIAALIVLRTGLLSSENVSPASRADAVCAGTVSVCFTGDTPAWSVTLKVNGRFAPPLGSRSRSPHDLVHVIEGNSMSFQLSVRDSAGKPLRDVYLFAYGRFNTGGAGSSPRGDAVVLLHRRLLPQAHLVTGSWIATPSPLDHDRSLVIGVSLRLGATAMYKQVDITEIVVAPQR